MAIKVKSGRQKDALPGTEVFYAAFKPQRALLAGGDGIRSKSSWPARSSTGSHVGGFSKRYAATRNGETMIHVGDL